MAKKKTWNEAEVFKRLRKRFASPAYVLLPQVRNGTGFSRRARTIDALAISVWPSRGLHLTGIEIKCSIGDWRNERDNPAKAEALQKYCKYWYVAAPPGVVPTSEVPETWGHIIVHTNKTIDAKGAEPLKPLGPDMLLLCAILRGCSQSMVTREEMQDRIHEENKVNREAIEKLAKLEIALYELERLKESVARFEEASGLKLGKYSGAQIGESVRFIHEHGIKQTISAAKRLRDSAQMIAEHLDRDLEELK